MNIDLKQEYNLRLTGEQIILVEKTLQQLPYKDSAPILVNMAEKVTPFKPLRKKN